MTARTMNRLHGSPPEARAETPEDSARRLITCAARRHGDGLVMSTSFGIQSAALLHLATSIVPDLPIVWVDTGYLPEETYRFAAELEERLGLDLHVASSPVSPARMEAIHGRLWERTDRASLDEYDRVRKVEPMRRALDELGATGWIAGLRADQTDHRSALEVVGEQWGRTKYLPILDWTKPDLHRYLKAHDLPYHPLLEEGYATVGDWHSSRPVGLGDTHERDTRFHGLKQECGLHVT
ncbi:MAG: phosphoadenylyl-sulfate reductase [Myxococcota bacterium]